MKELQPCLLGAVAGDIIGSAYEWHPVDDMDFPLFGPRTSFTDDTVLTVAVADHFVSGRPYADVIHRYGNDYPHRGYGGNFSHWLQSPEKQPYNSFGNGSAMRVSLVGFDDGIKTVPGPRNTRNTRTTRKKTAPALCGVGLSICPS